MPRRHPFTLSTRTSSAGSRFEPGRCGLRASGSQGAPGPAMETLAPGKRGAKPNYLTGEFGCGGSATPFICQPQRQRILPDSSVRVGPSVRRCRPPCRDDPSDLGQHPLGSAGGRPWLLGRGELGRMGYRESAFIAWSPRNLSAQIQSSSRLRGAAFGKSSIVSHLVNGRAQSMLPPPLPRCTSDLFSGSR